MTIIRKAVLATALAASALTSVSPAMARGYGGWGNGYRHHRHHGGDDAAIAIGAGIVGLAIGAMVAAGSHDRNNARYRDRDYRNDGSYNDQYYRDGWKYRDGTYYDQQGRRYDRDNWNRQYGDRYDRRDGSSRYDDNDGRWDRGD